MIGIESKGNKIGTKYDMMYEERQEKVKHHEYNALNRDRYIKFQQR